MNLESIIKVVSFTSGKSSWLKARQMKLKLLLFFAFLSNIGLINSTRAESTAPNAPAADGEADDDSTSLAKKIQNPVGDVYSVPFQSNSNFGYGPHRGAQEILNIQPVIPLHITSEWNIITRTVLPLV